MPMTIAWFSPRSNEPWLGYTPPFHMTSALCFVFTCFSSTSLLDLLRKRSKVGGNWPSLLKPQPDIGDLNTIT
jgi:hypothetical protein